MQYELEPFRESVDYLVKNYTARELAIAYLKVASAKNQEIDDRLARYREVQPTENPVGNLCSESVAIDQDGFIVWEGGANRPVPDTTIVHVKVRSGIPRDPIDAVYWPQICWQWRESDDPMNKWDIVAYKVIK